MNTRTIVSFLALLLLSCGFATVAKSSEIVANLGNEEAIDKASLKLMLIGKEKFWGSGSEVVIAILKSDPEIDDVLARYSGMTTNKFKNHWQRIAFSGRGKMPKMFSNIEDLIEFVESNEGAIGIVTSTDEKNRLRRIELGMMSSSVFTSQFAGL